MSYIRGALPFLIYNPNTRDDIVPDGVTASFELSQEVPGGYENNVQVIRRELKSDVLVQSCAAISFSQAESQIVCSNAAIAAALSFLSEGDVLVVSGSAQTTNNDTFLISSIVYNGESIIITVDGSLVDEAAGSLITLTKKFAGPWEVLQPEVDFVIGGTGDQTNRIITLSRTPQESDAIYVVHRGEATYNFVPTEKSVGPDQLQENLRNFRVDIYIGDGTSTVFDLTQFAVNPKSLEVSIDGLLKYASDSSWSFVGDFDLSPDGLSIEFATAPTVGSKIYIRHLGFSTISRRQTLSPSQIGGVAPGSIDTESLANNAVTSAKLADGAVTNPKLAANAVSGAKLLLNNNEWLNAKSATSPFAGSGLLKLNASNFTTLRTPGSTLSFEINSAKSFSLTNSAFFDATASGQVSIGTVSNKFSDGHFAGSVNATSGTFNNLTVNGNLIVTGVVGSGDLSGLQNQITALAALVQQHNPAGTIKIWMGNVGAPTGYVLCDGAPYSKDLYPDLFAVLGYTFGGAGATFNVPDLRGRFPLGRSSSGTGSGWGTGTTARSGSLDHNHKTSNHQHGLANHSHPIPPHFHSVRGRGSLTSFSHDREFSETNSNSITRLKINSSGTHQTDLAHAHSSGTTQATPHTHLVDFQTTPIALNTPDGEHGHTGSGVSGTPVAYDSNNVLGARSLDHVHQVLDIATKAAQLSGSGFNLYYQPSTTSPNLPTSDQRDVSNSATGKSLQHRHEFSVSLGGGSHSHRILGYTKLAGTAAGQTNDPDKNGSHVHTFTVPALAASNFSTSNGAHSHGAEFFEGAIGNLEGSNGDGVWNGSQWASLLNTGAPSTNLSESAGAGTTEGANPAFQTVNFIIKT